MDSEVNEGFIKGTIGPLTIEKNEIILEQMKKCICKIYGNKIGTGFFCKILYQKILLPVLITNFSIIDNDFLLYNKQIKISLNNDKVIKFIIIDKERKLYFSPKNEYDIMIIRLKGEDEIYNYLELDDNIYNNNSEMLYKNDSIYILHYPKEKNILVSYGLGIEKESYFDMKYKCNMGFGSSGAPILNLLTNKVIGIHKRIVSKDGENLFNIGSLLKYPLIELNAIKLNKNIFLSDQSHIMKINKKINEINLELKIGIGDINKDIYFLDNSFKHNNLKELNSSNTEIYIDKKKYKFCKYFRPLKQGNYFITIKFNIPIKDCSYMFYNCGNIININLSYFDANEVTNMEYMFSWCKNLININFTNFNTQNVTNMSNIFSGCFNLQYINVSSFDTKKVTNMEYMFCGCENLKNINLSSFNTKKVVNMENMFNGCNKLENIDLSHFDSKNVLNMANMFLFCNRLTKMKIMFEFYQKIKHELEEWTEIIYS